MQDELTVLSSPLAKELAVAELESLRRLASVLERFEPKQESDFAMVVCAVLRSRFSQRELADTFKVSPGTISRWAAGASAPPSYARGVIVAQLRDALTSELNTIRERLRSPEC